MTDESASQTTGHRDRANPGGEPALVQGAVGHPQDDVHHLGFRCLDLEAVQDEEYVGNDEADALFLIDDAEVLEDLRVPPGSRLEALKGDRRGQYSIRINDQYRICFRWTEQGARDVEIVDYHA